jgi:hypothetical protein
MIKEASGVCQRLKARLPEIRDKQTQNDIRSYANLHDISRIAAGITYNQELKLFNFNSDGANARTNSPFSTIEFGGSYANQKNTGDYEHDSYLNSESENYPLIYRYPGSHFVLRLADSHDRTYNEHIMCEQEPDIAEPQVNHETNWLTQLAFHNCKRSQNSLLTNSQFTLSEIVSITTLNFTVSTQEPDWTTFFPKFESLAPNDQNLLRPKRFSGFGVHIGILNEARNLANVKNLVAMKPLTTTTTPSTTTPYKYPYTLSFEKHWFIPDSAYEYLYYAVQPNTITKTIPDLVNILHAFWRIQQVEKFNELDFPKWMEQQGKRWPFYAFFRRIPTIHRLQRDLFSTFSDIQNKALTGDIHDSDFIDELNNLDKLIEAYFKANENEFSDEHLSFESLRPEIPKSTSINHNLNKRSPAPIFPVIAAATFGSIAGAGIATLTNT